MAYVTMEQCVEEEKDEPLVLLPRGKRMFFVAILYLCFTFDLAIRYGVNAILPLLQNDLGISGTQIGLLSSAVFLGMAIFVMPFSFFGAQYGQKKAISLCSILWSGVTVLCGFAQGAVSLALLRLGVGAGNSAYAAVSTDMLTSWYKKSSWGKVLGLYNTAMTIGAVVGMILFAAIAETMGWRMSFYIIGGISLVISLLTFLIPDNRKVLAEQKAKEAAANGGKSNGVEQKKLSAGETFKFLLTNKALLLMCLGAGIAVMTLNIGSTFMSIYYVNMMGISATAAAGLIALSTPIGLVAYPLGGAILDKWYQKDRRARMWMPMVCIVLAAVIFFFGYKMVSVPMILIAGGFYNLGNTSFHTAAHELVPVWYKSVSYGIYVLFIQLLGAVGPTLGGIMVDKMGVQAALVNSSFLFAASAVLLFLAGGIYIKYYNRAREEELSTGVCPE